MFTSFFFEKLISKKSSLSNIFLRWSFLRSVFHNGWWLVTSLYLVIEGKLTASQLVFIGVAQSVASIIFELPAGIFADTISRKWSLIISHIIMGTAMICTALVTGFYPLMMTQMLWGISWTFASGADIAWITDELDKPDVISNVLADSVKAQMLGAAIGIISLGIIAVFFNLVYTMLFSGIAILSLAFYILITFQEKKFIPTKNRRILVSWNIFKEGMKLISRSRIILVFFLTTFIINGAADAYARLFPKRLTSIGFPHYFPAIVWLTVINVLTLFIGVLAVNFVQKTIEESRKAKINYAFFSILGAIALFFLAITQRNIIAYASILVIGGGTLSVTRTLSTILVNNQTANNVRATVHSSLAQAEYLGEIILGSFIGLIANFSNLSVSLGCCSILFSIIAFIMFLEIDR